MGFFKFLYSKDSVKRKILDIKDEIQKTIEAVCDEKFWVIWYGAYQIDPKNLVFWICVKSDRMKLKLISDKELYSKLRQLLSTYDYPAEAIAYVGIDFESQETVDRVSDGSWYVHFK